MPGQFANMFSILVLLVCGYAFLEEQDVALHGGSWFVSGHREAAAGRPYEYHALFKLKPCDDHAWNCERGSACIGLQGVALDVESLSCLVEGTEGLVGCFQREDLLNISIPHRVMGSTRVMLEVFLLDKTIYIPHRVMGSTRAMLDVDYVD